ncbi:MAG: metallophosphoesterase family protein [Burkholderiales bacterium]
MIFTHGKRGLALLLPFLVGACAAQAPLPPGALVFGVLGDAPYTEAEIGRLDAVIDRINAEALAFVVHVGDLGSSTPEQACGDRWLEARKKQLGRIRHPFLLIPGDNEWSDCKQPLERLRTWRQLFCGAESIAKLSRQGGEYCEHVRWERDGWVFVALNVPGPDNHIRHPEHAPRMRAVFDWLDEAAKLASNAKGLVVLMQANPFRPGRRDGFAPLRERLQDLGARSPRRIILIHGDTHLSRDDEPLPGMRRIEVWGSPFVDWTRVDLP